MTSMLALAEPDDFDLPKSVVPASKLEFEEVQTATLPKLLQRALLADDEIGNGSDRLPESLYICRIDLNGDGSLEYIVDVPQNYSGGRDQVVFERHKNGYEDIARFQGGFHLAARVNGYYQICGSSRLGGGSRQYYILRYAKGEYHGKTWVVHPG